MNKHVFFATLTLLATVVMALGQQSQMGPEPALPDCNYGTVRLPGNTGVLCPNLPGNPPANAIADGYCEYYWCDSNTACGSNQYQKWMRSRTIFRTPGDPDFATYYSGGLTGADSPRDCCKCKNTYFEILD